MFNLTHFCVSFRQIVFILGLPILQVVLFCGAIGHDPTGLPLGVVNGAFPLTDADGNVLADADGNPVAGCGVTNETDHFESCRLLAKLFSDDGVLVPTVYPDSAAARADVMVGKVWGFVELDANFDEAYLAGLSQGAELDQATRDEGAVLVRLDHSNKQVLYGLRRTVHDAHREYLMELLARQEDDIPAGVADLPLMFGDAVYGLEDSTFTDFMAPGTVILIVYFLAVALTGDILISEKEDGLMDR
jgi:hypothetical protein